MKKVKKPTALTAAELAKFQLLHAEVALAHERVAHATTRAQLADAKHEIAALTISAQRSANMRASEAAVKEKENDVAAAKAVASDFARMLSETYSVDLKQHAVCPHTGEFITLPSEGNPHG